MINRRHLRNAFCLFLFVDIFCDRELSAADENDQPICTIAAISSPYITTLSAKELGKRSWIEKVAPAGLNAAIQTVNAIKPDAFVVLGSLTWNGSDADLDRLDSFLKQVKVPTYLVPGPNELTDGGLERFQKHFGKQNVAQKSIRVHGVHLQFASAIGSGPLKNEQELLDWMEQDFSDASDATAVLLFGGLNYPPLGKSGSGNPQQQHYWQMIDKHKVAARFIAGHAHSVTYEASLPTWSIPSSGWSYTPKWHASIITVYPQRVELTLLREPEQPVQTLTIPNPVAAPRMTTAAKDPFGVPSYSEDLANKPDLTFIQLSDSQFDDQTVPRYGARYKHDVQMNTLAAKQVNRLNPAMVFMTGDLTNKNTKAEWKTFQSIYSKLKPPLYTMPGNHDTLYDREKLDQKTLGDLLASGVKNWKLADQLAGKKTVDRTALYRHFIGREPYYAVEKNGCVFLCLNTGVAAVDGEQMKWLRSELERTKDAKHVFVLGHYPVLKHFGGNVQGPEAEEILFLLRKYKVAAYLSGHRHRYDYRMHDGTMHMLCNCLCWGEYLSYQIYHVFPDRIVACWKPIFRAEGNRPLYERVILPEPRFTGRD